MDFLSLNEYVHQLRGQVAAARDRIGLMEAGELQVRHHKPESKTWVDVTAHEINREKQIVAVLNAILARHPDGMAK